MQATEAVAWPGNEREDRVFTFGQSIDGAGMSITYDELVRERFVPPEEQERLRRYLDAKKRFDGFFGPFGTEPDAAALDALRHAEEEVSVVWEQLRERVGWLRGEVLPVVNELFRHDGERLAALERQTARLGEAISHRPTDVPLRELVLRMEEALKCNHAIRQLLFELREQHRT